MCEVLSPGLAVSVLKAIFQEVHVQVSNVISYPPVLDLCLLCFWEWPTAPKTGHIQHSAVLLQSSETAWITARETVRDRQQPRILFGPCPLFSQP